MEMKLSYYHYKGFPNMPWQCEMGLVNVLVVGRFIL